MLGGRGFDRPQRRAPRRSTCAKAPLLHRSQPRGRGRALCQPARHKLARRAREWLPLATMTASRQEQIRAADATVAGSVHRGPAVYLSPRTGSPAFGGELPARPVSLRERISGTPQPTGVTGEPFYTAFRVEFCAAKQHYSAHLSTLLTCSYH